MASFSSFPYRTISSQMLSEILDGWETNHESVVSKETGLSMCHNRSVRYFCVTKVERKHIEMRHSIIRFVIPVLSFIISLFIFLFLFNNLPLAIVHWPSSVLLLQCRLHIWAKRFSPCVTLKRNVQYFFT